MNLDILPYLFPYFVSLLISISIGFFAWNRRTVVGALPFSISALGQASWTFGYIFEIASDNLHTKLFWDNFQIFGGLIWLLSMFAFAIQYTGYKLSSPRLIWGFLLVGGISITVVIYTDQWHGLAHPDVEVQPGDPFSSLIYDFSTFWWLVYAYLLVIFGYNFYILLSRFPYSFQLYRSQATLVILGNMVPLVGMTLTINDITLAGQRDMAPLTFAMGNLIVAWGLFRYHLFDLVPIAREILIENMRDMVLVVDADNRLVDLNPAAEQGIGRGAAELIGQDLEETLTEWSHLVKQFRQVEEGQYEVPARVRGEERYFDLQFSPLRNRRGQFVGRLIVARDITERKHAEDEIKLRTHQVEEVNRRLEAANEELRYLSQIKDEFVSNVSHELRTPITILKLNEEFLRMRPDKWEIYLERIERETGRLERIIEDLLRLSRIDQERVDFDPQPLDLNAFIEQYVEDRAVLADRKSIQLTCEKMPDLPPILADKGLMGQVLSILLTNALNYTPSQGSVAVKTQLRQQDGRQWAGFYVKDSGPGIPASEQGQLFERFFRGSVGRNSGEAGTGLGLAIAREIVIRHNGIIEMESTGIPGEGATFWVWLPLQNSLIPVKEPVP